jgi:hypothetical protein
MNARARRLLPLLFVALAGCASRPPAPQTEAAVVAPIPEGTVAQLVSAWQDEVCRYVDREGDGDPAVLSETRALRSRDALRPARVTFGLLDVDAGAAARDGWDVQGVLVGRQARGAVDRYVFLVGMVARSSYVPSGLQDVRLVGLEVQGGRLTWETGAADATAVQRYRETYRGSGAIRFPGDTDDFRLTVATDRVSVREMRSGAEWRLSVREDPPAARSAPYVFPVLGAPAARSTDRCAKRTGS